MIKSGSGPGPGPLRMCDLLKIIEREDDDEDDLPLAVPAPVARSAPSPSPLAVQPQAQPSPSPYSYKVHTPGPRPVGARHPHTPSKMRSSASKPPMPVLCTSRPSTTKVKRTPNSTRKPLSMIKSQAKCALFTEKSSHTETQFTPRRWPEAEKVDGEVDPRQDCSFQNIANLSSNAILKNVRGDAFVTPIRIAEAAMPGKSRVPLQPVTPAENGLPGRERKTSKNLDDKENVSPPENPAKPLSPAEDHTGKTSNTADTLSNLLRGMKLDGASKVEVEAKMAHAKGDVERFPSDPFVRPQPPSKSPPKVVYQCKAPVDIRIRELERVAASLDEEEAARKAGENCGRQFKTLTIKGKKYTIMTKLGVGGSSQVFKVMDAETSAMFAVKCVNLAVDSALAKGYINEIKLLQQLQGSDRVITMDGYEYVKEQKMLYVKLEMGEIDLSSLMKSYRARRQGLPLPILVGYWTEMLSAVNYIHSNGIIHSDLKPANFLLVRGRLKLIDFGIASALASDVTSVVKDSTFGTLNYISPEAVMGGSGGRDPIKISYKSDVWSLGCILYSMVYGQTPFSAVPNNLKLVKLCSPNHAICYPTAPGIPPVLMHAMRWCLTFDPKKRPTVQQLIDLPYINTAEINKTTSSLQIPMPLLLKIKATLSEDEWRLLIESQTRTNR